MIYIFKINYFCQGAARDDCSPCAGALGAPQGKWVGPAARSHPTTPARNRVAGGTRPASAPGAKARLRLCQAVGPWVQQDKGHGWAGYGKLDPSPFVASVGQGLKMPCGSWMGNDKNDCITLSWFLANFYKLIYFHYIW